ncbi:ferrioxamine B transporter [Hortaea werneckii]|nr:ferrioxamine B transporter [Hortaea werneckii]
MSQNIEQPQSDISKRPNENFTSSNDDTAVSVDSAEKITSPGVARIEAINRNITVGDRVALFIGVFLIAYAYGLDGQIRNTYQTTALSTFGEHSLISTVNVVRTVISAAAQPTAGKIADVFGRLEVVYVSVLFYVVGTIIQAASNTVGTFCAGAIIYQIGLTVITFLVEVIVADITSLRSRLLWSYIAATPFIINTWVSGNVAQSVLDSTTWRWGIGMWAIIYPALSMPLVVSLLLVAFRTKRRGELTRSAFRKVGLKQFCTGLFWRLDVIGVLLVIAIFALILVPFTLAGGQSSTWGQGYIIAPLVIGICLIPAFICWERWTVHPLVPFHLLTDRSVWGSLGVAWMLNFTWYLQGDYLYTVLRVSFDETVNSATRIASLYSFVSVITGVILSLVVRFFTPYLKPWIVFGTVMFMVSFGILIEYRGGTGTGDYAGVVAGQCVLGFAGGLFPYPTQVIIQTATQHEHLALVTGLYLALYNIGSAFGNSVAGAMWTQILPGRLDTKLAQVTSNSTVATTAFGDPIGFIAEYPVGTPERAVVIDAYRYMQRLLCICGICLCVLLIAFSLVLRNPRLGKEQSLPEAEKRKSDAHSASSDHQQREE